jgi:hypothetical protein
MLTLMLRTPVDVGPDGGMSFVARESDGPEAAVLEIRGPGVGR